MSVRGRAYGWAETRAYHAFLAGHELRHQAWSILSWYLDRLRWLW